MRVEQTLQCEWDNCIDEVNCLSGKGSEERRISFTTHCERHVFDALNSAAAAAGAPMTEFQCQWHCCDARFESSDPDRLFEEAACHVTQHAHHVIIKCQGLALIQAKGWPQCSLNSAFCNSIADQVGESSPLRCDWDTCEYATCNTFLYYLHCSNHRFEYERKLKDLRQLKNGKSTTVDMPCLWRGCSQVCKSISNLTEHIRTHTKEKPVACPTCGQKFFNNSKFENHLMRQQTAKVAFKCDHCHKVFSSQRILSDHMRRHVNTRKCPQCEFTLPTPSSLRRHMQMRHSDEKPYLCTEPDCGHRCKTEDALKVHSRRHDRSLRCDICDQHFVTTHFLYRHLSTAHGFNSLSQTAERMYACHLCSMVTKDSRSLSRHLIRRHRLFRPAGFAKFRFEPGPDGLCRVVQTRLESIEVTKELLGPELVERQLGLQQRLQQSSAEPLPTPSAVQMQLPHLLQQENEELRHQQQQQQQHLESNQDEYFLPLLGVNLVSTSKVDDEVLADGVGHGDISCL